MTKSLPNNPRGQERDSDLYLTLGLYQRRVLETALPSARSIRYQIPALISEIGEVLGVFAKEVRDAEGKPNYPARKAELGDVAYMTALLLNDLGATTVTPAQVRKGAREYLNTTGAANAYERTVALAEPVVRAAARYGTEQLSPRQFANRLTHFWVTLKHLSAAALMGMPEYDPRRAAALSIHTPLERSDALDALADDIFQDVLYANVYKLADRKRRGKITGSGDNR